MPLQLNFRIEDRSGVMVLITGGKDGDVVRPASSAEVELWNALSRRFAAPARESYIRVNEQDLLSVLMERDHLRRATAEQAKTILELESRTKASDTNEQEGHVRPSPQEGDAGGSPGREPES